MYDQLNNKIFEIRSDRYFNMSLDLGCGSYPRNPFGASTVIGADLFTDSPFKESETLIYKKMSGFEIPLASNSVDALTAFDFFEHIPRILQKDNSFFYPFIEIMNESSRVLKSGGVLFSLTPAWPSGSAFSDPTHVNFITKNTLDYFSNESHAGSLGYGFNGNFETAYCDWTSFNNPIWKTSQKFVLSSTVSYEKLFARFAKYYYFLNRGKRSHIAWILFKK